MNCFINHMQKSFVLLMSEITGGLKIKVLRK